MKERNDGILIQPMESHQLESVLQLQEQIVPFAIDRTSAESCWAQIRNNPDYILLVAVEGQAVVGTVTVIVNHCLGADFLVLEDVVVDPNCRRRGIGRMLLETVDRIAEEKQAAYTILVSSGFRKEAHRFYESMGYTEEVRGFRKMYIQPEW